MASGRVKWFNSASGYGFIVPDGDGVDLFVHRTSIGGEARGTVTEGERVEFEPREGGMGPEAIDVVAVAQAGLASHAGLDWAAFTARFYPSSRRHEAEPLAAYEAYRKDLASRTRA